jgi:hypothetical protein
MTVERLLNVMTVLSLGLILLVLRDVRRAHIRVEYAIEKSFAVAGAIPGRYGPVAGAAVRHRVPFLRRLLSLLHSHFRTQRLEHLARSESGDPGVPPSVPG